LAHPFGAGHIRRPVRARNLGRRRLRDLPLIQHLHGGFARAVAGARPPAGRPGLRSAAHTSAPLPAPRRSVWLSAVISRAAAAASRPLFDGPGTARSSASSAEFVVSTPKLIGTPVASEAFMIPCEVAD